MVPDLSPPPVPFSKSSPSNDPISTADFDGINASVNSSCSTGIGTGSCAEGVMVAMTSSKGRHRRRSWFMHVEGNGIKKQKGNLDNAKQSLGERRHLDIRETTTIIDSELSSVRPVRISIRNTHLHTHTRTHVKDMTYQTRLGRPVTFASSAGHPWDLYRFRTLSRPLAPLASGLEPVRPHLAACRSLSILSHTPGRRLLYVHLPGRYRGDAPHQGHGAVRDPTVNIHLLGRRP